MGIFVKISQSDYHSSHLTVYTLQFGTAPHLKQKVVKQLQKWPFSINYDESVKGKASQLELCVSYRDTEDRIQKAHLVTVNMVERLTGENISKALFNAMDGLNVPYKEMLVSERTDGCATMLGVHKGCHVFNQKVVPQLPDLGGCSCHDACNTLKAGMIAMNPDLPSLWKALFPCLEKASVKKTLHYMETCQLLGIIYKHAPKFLDVRFRYTVKLAMFCEENDQALYTYFKEFADRFQESDILPSENEATVVKVYLGNYIKTRLCHQFLIEVGDPFIRFIDFFESRAVRGHLIYPKMALLLNQFFSMFLKSGDRATATPKELLLIKYKDPEQQLSKEKVFIGDKARSFMKKVGLSSSSRELEEFFEGVTKFFHGAAEKLVKYFETPLSSRSKLSP